MAGIEVIYSTIPDSNTPARYYFQLRKLVINIPVFKKLNEYQRAFVLLHELGHAELNTKNEFEADNYALKRYLQMKLPKSQVIETAGKTFSQHNPEQMSRMRNQFTQLALYDIKVNNNQKLKQKLSNMKTPTLANSINFMDASSPIIDNSEFLGLFKSKEERKKAREQRQKAREQRQEARLLRKQTRAEQGTTVLGGLFKDIYGSIYGGLTNLLGGTPSEQVVEEVEAESSNKNTIIIIAVLIIIAIIAFVIFKKK